MSEKRNLWRVESDRLYLDFHSGQQAAWDSDKRFILVLAGTQSGKTSFGPWWLYREIQRRGEGDYLAVEATYDLFKLKMLPEMRTVFEDILRVGEYKPSERVMEIREPKARIILRSADADGGLESATAKGAWLDEAGLGTYSLNTWDAIRRRLSLHRGRVLVTSTLYELGWLTDFLDKYEAGKLPDFTVIQFDSTANPSFPVEEYEQRRRDMPAWKFAMLYQGKKARPSGLIYNDYNPVTHRVKPFPIPEDWPLRAVGVDPGGSNTGLVWLAESPEGLCYVYHELRTGDLPTPELVEKVRAIDDRVTSYWGGAPGEKQVRMDWRAAGTALKEPPVSDVEQGLDRVIKLLRGNRLYVMENCAGLHQELNSYSRVLDENNEPTNEIKDKEKYHLLDALRYVVSGLERPKFTPIALGKPAFTGGR